MPERPAARCVLRSPFALGDFVKYLPVALPLMAACSRDQPRHASHDTGQVPACAAGELLDDAQQCVPEACGSTHWGDIEDASFYVDASAGEGGTGSIDAPFSTIAAAIEAAHAAGGGRIAIAAGTYLENLVLDSHADDAELIGRCPDLVVLDGSNGSSDQPTVERAGSSSVSATLARMTITGGPEGGLLITRGDVLGQELRVVDNAGVGALVYSKGVLTLEDSLVAGTTEGSAQGRGLDIELGGVATLRNAVVEGNEGEGIYTSQADAAVYLYDSSVLDNGGRGVNAQSGALFHAENSVIRGNSDVGIAAFDKGTSVTLIDTEVSSTAEAGAGREGRGVSVADGAVLTATGCSVLANRNVGVNVSGTYDDGTPAQATLSDCTISGTRSSDRSGMGRGVNVQQGGQVELSGCMVTDNQQDGVYAGSEGTVVTLSSTTISDTISLDEGLDGYGLAVEDGAVVVATDCTITNNRDVGVNADGGPTLVTLQGCEISRTQPLDNGSGGSGINAQNGATVEADDCDILDNHTVGVLLNDPDTWIELSNSRISGTRATSAWAQGRGVGVQKGAELIATDCTIEDNQDAAVYASGSSTIVYLGRCDVLGTIPADEVTFAGGVLAQDGALVEVDHSTIASHEGPGVYVVSGGEVSCTSCLLRDNAIAGAFAVNGGRLALEDSAVESTRTGLNEDWSMGVLAVGETDGTLLDAPIVTLTRTTITNDRYAAVWLQGPGSYTIDDCELSGGPGFVAWGETVWHGDALYAAAGVDTMTDGIGLSVSSTHLYGSRHGLFLDGAGATLSGNTWADNEVDIYQQECDEVTQLSEDDVRDAGSTTICTGVSRSTEDLVFAGLYFDDSEGH